MNGSTTTLAASMAAAGAAVGPPLPQAPGLAVPSQQLQLAAAAASSSAAAATKTTKTARDRLEQRREKSREHAKRSRDKKKAFMETLEEEAKMLQKENDALRALVRTRLPDEVAQGIVGECCYDNTRNHALLTTNGFGTAARSGGGGSGTKNLAQGDFGLIESLTAGRQSFVLTDPRLPDNPIVYASGAFCDLTGYSRDQVLGRNCRFLQGPETDSKAVDAVRNAIASGRDATMVLLNFKQDGTPFWNQFFVAALRDRQGNIVNYVGVQSPTDPPKSEDMENDAADSAQTQRAAPYNVMAKNKLLENPGSIGGGGNAAEMQQLKAEAPSASVMNIPSPAQVIARTEQFEQQLMDMDENDDDDDSIEVLDWSLLADALENDYIEEHQHDDGFGGGIESGNEWPDNVYKVDAANTSAAYGPDEPNSITQSSYEGGYGGEGDASVGESNLYHFTRQPRSFATKTVRSEVIDSLLSSHGDTRDPRFSSALDVLSSVYKASGQNACSSSTLGNLLDGNWRSLSRPAYEGCLGMNDFGDFLYTLEKMSFGMFKPPNLRCSVQRTMSNIAVGKRVGMPTLVPWSLRRELATLDPHNDDATSAHPNPSVMLKSYDIAVSMTIEKEQDEKVPHAPSSRLKALKVVKGYMLPDPNTPNRLTVWFTGGKLSPAPSSENEDPAHQTQFGGFEDWKAVFGGKYKKSWGESFRDMGAKLFLGAELPDGMTKSGSMSYTLHRPFGGHGKAYVDIVYLDEHVLITRGNFGTIYAMVRDSSLPEAEATAVTSDNMDVVPNPTSSQPEVEDAVSKKRKASMLDVDEDSDGVAAALDRCHVRTPVPDGSDNVSNPILEAKRAKLTPNANALPEKNFFDLTMLQQPLPPKTAAEASFARSTEHQSSNEGIRNILSSVESFFTTIRGG